jgi:hypothetical protein
MNGARIIFRYFLFRMQKQTFLYNFKNKSKESDRSKNKAVHKKPFSLRYMFFKATLALSSYFENFSSVETIVWSNVRKVICFIKVTYIHDVSGVCFTPFFKRLVLIYG